MNDSISNRIRRIITGSASSIVSKIEGLAPEAILAQAIAEIDSALDEIKAELGRLTAQKYHVTKAMMKLNDEHNRISEQMEAAKRDGRKDLLEAAISRQLDIEDQLPALENQLGDLSRQEGELSQAITGLVAKRNEMDDELFEFKQVQNQATSMGESQAVAGAPSASNAAAKAERANRAFTRVLQDATGVRRSAIKANSDEAGKLVELAQLNKRARIDARLKAIASE